VDGEQAPGALGVVDRAHRAEAELPDLVERGVVGVSAGTRKKDALQRGAAAARDGELAGGEQLSQDA
jgi:hypothetical protein